MTRSTLVRYLAWAAGLAGLAWLLPTLIVELQTPFWVDDSERLVRTAFGRATVASVGLEVTAAISLLLIVALTPSPAGLPWWGSPGWFPVWPAGPGCRLSSPRLRVAGGIWFRPWAGIGPRERCETCAVLHSCGVLPMFVSPARPRIGASASLPKRCWSSAADGMLLRVRSDLRAELLQRTEQDQAARCAPEPDWELLAAVDADNVAWLREVVAGVGWPGQSMVGEDGAHAAWLLAQHADQDPAFQRRCLELLTQAVTSGEAAPAALAYLI